jgi:hypothetical protein
VADGVQTILTKDEGGRMNVQSTFQFQWQSPLGIGAALFLVYGAFYIFIGALTPFVSDTNTGRQVTVSSVERDNALLGGRTPDLLQASPALAKMRFMLLNMIGGLLVAAGLLILAVTWFGLRQGQIWALVTLALAGSVVLPFWWLVFRPFREAGINVGLDLPPFILIPGLLLVPASLLGIIGLR